MKQNRGWTTEQVLLAFLLGIGVGFLVMDGLEKLTDYQAKKCEVMNATR